MVTERMYFDTSRNDSCVKFSEAFYSSLASKILYGGSPYDEIIFLCIGSDRATGDCLGPLAGEKFASSMQGREQAVIYGTLDHPVHAINLSDTIGIIYEKHRHPLVVAIDASLGLAEHIGFFTLAQGSLLPGAGLNKRLPAVGDISITGIVNIGSGADLYTLQNTRLSIVMKLADEISKGVMQGLLRLKEERYLHNRIRVG